MSLGIGQYDQYYFSVIVVLGTMSAAAFLLWLCQRSRWAPFIRTFRGIAQNFLTVINVIFALNLAFLANDTWNAHDRALNAVFQEAGSLRTIIDLAEHLPQPKQAEIEGAVRHYADLTVDVEWPLLARRLTSPETDDALDTLLSRLSRGDLAAVAGASVQALMLQQAVQAREMREMRLALSRTHVNPLKWMGMAFLGFLTMISIAMVHVEQPRAELLAVLLFATAAAPTAAIILVHGNPFQHPMAVSPQPIAEAVATAPMTTGTAVGR
jgi:uncharacterized protein YbaA (DUF1428 family)